MGWNGRAEEQAWRGGGAGGPGPWARVGGPVPWEVGGPVPWDGGAGVQFPEGVVNVGDGLDELPALLLSLRDQIGGDISFRDLLACRQATEPPPPRIGAISA